LSFSWFFFVILLGLPLFILLLALRFFLLLDDFFELFMTFWSSSCASWCFGFELQILCFYLSMESSRGRLRNKVFNTLV
jgi:hypothetical protein